MPNRRNFLKKSAFATFLAGGTATFFPSIAHPSPRKGKAKRPVVISTWNFGLAANEAAWKVLDGGGSALDAAIEGAMVPESDPEESSVGYGGLPDREGRVTLDACVMNEQGNCGSVAFLENIKSPVQVARAVMEKTPHVMLVGDGAYQFAREQGFDKENLLTEKSKKAWKAWLKKSEYKPVINIENHDTIGILSLDAEGNLSGACTTSGLAYKMRGRVGDSPIIGAGLFVDNAVGAATATGQGEEIIKIAGSHLVVELMRQGNSPQDACKAAVERIVSQQPEKYKDFQVGFIAVNKEGETGGYSIHPGFNYAVMDREANNLTKASSYI